MPMLIKAKADTTSKFHVLQLGLKYSSFILGSCFVCVSRISFSKCAPNLRNWFQILDNHQHEFLRFFMS